MNKLMNTQKINDKRAIISLIAIFFVGLGLRFFYFPNELPLIADAMDNFTYETGIYYYGHLPTEWAPANNGWPIFLSFWFSIILRCLSTKELLASTICFNSEIIASLAELLCSSP